MNEPAGGSSIERPAAAGSSGGLRPLRLDLDAVPDPDAALEPDGFLVQVPPADRIHFLDWGPGPANAGRPPTPHPGVIAIHGLANTARSWTAVARRLARVRRFVALDLRGHGLSDAPTTGYDAATLAEDVLAVGEGSGLLAEPADRVVLAGHGFGAIVAAWAAAELGDRCAGLVLVDGGWENLEDATGEDAEAFLRTADEPPEILRSMTAFLADRRSWDPATWDADEEAAARASVVQLPVGRLVSATRPHALEASVRAMFDYRPTETLAIVAAPIVVLVAAENEAETRRPALDAVAANVAAKIGAGAPPPIRVAAFPSVGHNLLRYRPAEVAAAIVAAPTP